MRNEREALLLRSTTMYFQWVLFVLGTPLLTGMLIYLRSMGNDVLLRVLPLYLIISIPGDLFLTRWVEISRTGITQRCLITKPHQILWQEVGQAELRIINQKKGKPLQTMVFTRRLPEGVKAREKDMIVVQLRGDGIYANKMAATMEKEALLQLMRQRNITFTTVEREQN